jgi:cytochrome c5
LEYPYLQVVSGAQAGALLRLAEGGELSELTVGSQASRDVRLEDAGVSHLHARLLGGGARWKVVDLTSAEGTYVNGRRVDVSFITAGDRLRFGSVECIFHAPSARSYTARRVQVQGRKVPSWLVVTALVVTIAGAAGVNVWLKRGDQAPAEGAVMPQAPEATSSSVLAGGAAGVGSIPGSLEYQRGQEVYASACDVCHGSGVAGAPKLGDVAAWAPRIARGAAVLRERALKGYQGKDGFMPAKGGRVDLSDQAVIEAVDYIVANSK